MIVESFSSDDENDHARVRDLVVCTKAVIILVSVLRSFVSEAARFRTQKSPKLHDILNKMYLKLAAVITLFCFFKIWRVSTWQLLFVLRLLDI